MAMGSKAILFILCFNVAAFILAGMNIEPVVGLLPSLDIATLERNWNATATANSWVAGQGSLGSIFNIGDIFSTVNLFFNSMAIVIGGFTFMLYNLGLPSPIVVGLNVLWGFLLLNYLFHMISGREME